MWTYPEHWAIEGMTTETAAGVRTFHELVNKGTTPLNSPVDLPAKLTSNLPRAALVGRAALTIFNVAGLGLTAFSLYNYLQDDGITSTGGIVSTGLGCSHPGNSLCPQIGSQSSQTDCSGFAYQIGSAALSAGCWSPADTYTVQTFGQSHLITFKRKTTVYGSTIVNPGIVTTTNSTPTQSELETKINSTPTTNTQLFNALKVDDSKGVVPQTFPGFVLQTSSTDIQATPVVTQPEIVETTTDPMPDGSTQTTSVSESYAYYPSLTGTNASTGLSTSTPLVQNPFTGNLSPLELTNLEPGSENMDYQTFTERETTTTNNTTGETSTQTTVTNHGTGTTTTINNNTTTTTRLDICQTNPGILACSTLGTVPPSTPETVPTQNVGDFAMPASVSGSCPAPYSQTLTTGQTIAWSYEPVCTFGSSIRPVVIALALLAAAYIVSGAVRSPA